jgi:hypothetical protein
MAIIVSGQMSDLIWWSLSLLYPKVRDIMADYELLFFNDWLARPFLCTKLQAFCTDTASDAWLYISGKESVMEVTFEALPQDEFCYQEFWFLHGEKFLDNDSKGLEGYAFYQSTSFQKINDLFRTLVKSYRWVLMPWGGVHSYKAFAFLTSDKKLKERFLNVSENIVYPYALYQGSVPADIITKPYNPFISSYNVEANVEHAIKAIVFEDKIDAITGQCIWDACECNKITPLIVTNIFASKTVLKDNWGDAEYRRIYSFRLVDGTKMGIFMPQDRDSYLKMCGLSYWSVTACFVFSGTTQPEKIVELVNTIQTPYKYSDLCYLNSFLDSGDWVYALDRCHVDVSYSLFTTKDRNQLTRVASCIDVFLISCF